MVDLIGWLATTLSCLGNVFVVLEKRVGFIIWLISNFFWIYVDIEKAIYSQIIMMVVYASLNVWGYIFWRESESHWGIQENVYCVDCEHEVDRGYRLLKATNYNRIRDKNPKFRCLEHSKEYLKVLKCRGVKFSGFENVE